MSGPARHLLLLRHGQSTWNASRRWQGQADPPLSPAGEAQAREAAANLAGAGLSSVWTSDLVRARRSAEIIAAALGLGQVRVDADLREVDVGDWCGLTRPEIEARWPGMLADWSADRVPSPPNGETRAALAARGREAVVRVAAATAPGARALVVTHGGLIRTLDRALGAPPDPIDNLAGRWITVDGDGALVPGALEVAARPAARAPAG